MKLVISTILFPLIILITLVIIFIAAHEAFWNNTTGETETE